MNYEQTWIATATQLASESPIKFGWLLDGKYIGVGSTAIHIQFPSSLSNQGSTLYFPQLKKKIEDKFKSFGNSMHFEACFWDDAENDISFKYSPVWLSERIDYLEQCIVSLNKLRCKDSK
jgi:hypothetical protein